jgi:quinol monooxygenase YgiN
MLATTEQLLAKPGREAELEAKLEALSTAVGTEPGCHEVRLARSKHEPRLFLLLSRYTDDAALDQHTRMPHYTEALPALMDCLEEPPVVALFEEIGSRAQEG